MIETLTLYYHLQFQSQDLQLQLLPHHHSRHRAHIAKTT
jgi:hypothetical protein